MSFILEEEDVEYYKHDKNMPIYGYTVPDLPTILRICFNGDVSHTVVAKKQPISERNNDFCTESMSRWYKTSRWLRCRLTYNELDVKENSYGEITSGYVNLRKEKMWEERVADVEKVVLVIRRQAEHKETKLKGAKSFIRTTYLSWTWTKIMTVMFCWDLNQDIYWITHSWLSHKRSTLMLNSKNGKQNLTYKHHTEVQPVQIPKCLDLCSTPKRWMVDNR